MAKMASVRMPQVAAPSTPGLRERGAKPVAWLALFGVIFLVIQANAYIRWIASGNANRTQPGMDPLPGWMSVTLRMHEIGGVTLVLVCLYFFVVKPWRRERRMTLPGLAVFGLLASYWQDLGANYFNHVYTYNAGFVNFGSWYNFIPGWTSPRANHLVEPVLFSFPAIVFGVLPPAMFAAYLMRRAKARWPHLGKLQVLVVGMTFLVPFLFVLEVVWFRLGLYVLAGTIPALTLFQGEYYQYPVYEAILLGGLIYLPLAALLYFTDDKGRSLAEQGIEQLKLNKKLHGAVRALAVVGFVNLSILSYSAAMAFISLLPSFTWADDIVHNRSYLRNEVCGSGTTYACPSADIPIPRRGGAHIGPEGQVIPAG